MANTLSLSADGYSWQESANCKWLSLISPTCKPPDKTLFAQRRDAARPMIDIPR
jgi:hypothetical protein